MKKILLLLLLFPAIVNAQHLKVNRWESGLGEYLGLLLDNNIHRAYQLVDHPTTFSGLPDSIIAVAGGAHHGLFLSSSLHGQVWGYGDNGSGELGDGTTTNRTNPVRVTIDSLGNVFDSVVKISCGGSGEANPWASFALKSNGTMWGCGSLAGGMRGNNTFGGETHRYVQIPFPAGTVIKDFVMSFHGVALDTAGNVWTWGANYSGYLENCLGRGPTPNANVPTKITLPVGRRAVMIAGGGSIMDWVLLDNGSLLGWSYRTDYLGLTGNIGMGHTSYQPWLTDSVTVNKLSAPIDTIVTNSMYTYVICKDSTLWGWGDNVQANGGDGTEIDMRHYRGLAGYFPYAWDQNVEGRMQFSPKPIMPGKHNFTKIFGSTVLNFYVQVEDANDSLYGWGRNKGGVVGNLVNGVDSVAGDLRSYYPNSWDVLWPTYINPFRGTFITLTTCPLFIDSAGFLSGTYPLNTSGSAPVANAGTDQSISTSYTTLKGTWSVSSPARGLVTREWKYTSGPLDSVIMPLHANDTIAVAGLTTAGTYTFTYTVKDNNFKTTADVMTVLVGTLPPPTNAGGLKLKKGYHHKYIKG